MSEVYFCTTHRETMPRAQVVHHVWQHGGGCDILCPGYVDEIEITVGFTNGDAHEQAQDPA